MRYFFHIRDNDTLVRDDEGLICPDLLAAFVEAELSLRDLTNANLLKASRYRCSGIEVTDAHGELLAFVHASPSVH